MFLFHFVSNSLQPSDGKNRKEKEERKYEAIEKRRRLQSSLVCWVRVNYCLTLESLEEVSGQNLHNPKEDTSHFWQ